MRDHFPDSVIVADMKVADTGTWKLRWRQKPGQILSVFLQMQMIQLLPRPVRAASLYGIRIMADLINVPDPIPRALILENMGVDIICAHVGIDQQMMGKSSLDLLADLAALYSYSPCGCGRH